MKYVLISIFIILFACNKGKVQEIHTSESLYLNHNDTVKYVGKESCKSCHYDIYRSFNQTGMGESFDIATKSKSVLDENNNPLIYDTIKNLYYQPLWKNDSLYLLEFRLQDKDTIHKFIQKIDFVILS